MFDVVLLVFMAFALGMVGLGVVGLTSGWIHPWERGRVLRPVAHGLGHIFSGSGFFYFWVFLSFALSEDVSPKLLVVAVVLFSIGTVLRGVATFPDR